MGPSTDYIELRDIIEIYFPIIAKKKILKSESFHYKITNFTMFATAASHNSKLISDRIVLQLIRLLGDLREICS